MSSDVHSKLNFFFFCDWFSFVSSFDTEMSWRWGQFDSRVQPTAKKKERPWLRDRRDQPLATSKKTFRVFTNEKMLFFVSTRKKNERKCKKDFPLNKKKRSRISHRKKGRSGVHDDDDYSGCCWLLEWRERKRKQRVVGQKWRESAERQTGCTGACH